MNLNLLADATLVSSDKARLLAEPSSALEITALGYARPTVPAHGSFPDFLPAPPHPLFVSSLCLVTLL